MSTAAPGANPTGWRRPVTKPLDYSVAALMLAVWIANGGLIAAMVFVYLNWRSIDWMVGSKPWSIVLMVAVSIVLFTVLFAGCCILGFRQHIERTYLVLRRKSPSFRMIFLWIVPMALLGFLLTLGLLSIVETDVATQYIREHSNKVFDQARKGDAVITKELFTEYMLTQRVYQQMYEQNQDEFQKVVMRIFDRMAVANQGYADPVITRNSMFHGFLVSLEPLRISFGGSLLTYAGVLLFFFIVYHSWYSKLTNSRFEEKVRELLRNVNNRRYAYSEDQGVEIGTVASLDDQDDELDEDDEDDAFRSDRDV